MPGGTLPGYNVRMTLNRIAARAALIGLAVLVFPERVPAQVLDMDGAAALGTTLRKLGTTKRVLMIGAHPDDENTALLAELALGEGADVAYLSLTRGEGGQNLIGPELQEGLGLIRTEELLAARRLDGARQFFTRAYDYGFSKSADEAFFQWPRDSLLADVVEVVRRYRPDVIVSVFSGTPADGHGQHQAAGIMAREAFSAAGDPARFTGQIARGLQPHVVRNLFQVLWRPPADPEVTMEVGHLDPLLGRSRYQVAMQSRSRHRSQDMGRAEPLGPQRVALTRLATQSRERLSASHTPPFASIFQRVDTTLVQHARSASAPAEVVNTLEQYERDVARLRASFNPLVRGGVTDALVDGLRSLDGALSALADDRFHALRATILAERDQAATALLMDAGVVIDVTADTPAPVPGTTFGLTATVWNGGDRTIGLSGLRPALPAGWTAVADGEVYSGLAPDEVVRRTWRVSVPADAEPVEPYFLRAPRRGAMYSWAGVPDSVRTLPFQPHAVGVDGQFVIGGPIAVSREAEYVGVDKAVGEVRQPLLVLPAASVHVEPAVAVIPTGDVAPRRVEVSVRSARDSMRGTVSLRVPEGWVVEPASAPVTLTRAGDAVSLPFTVSPPAAATGLDTLRAVFAAGGVTYDEGYAVIDYPHTRPHALYRPAHSVVSVVPVRIAEGLRVGYIEGAGDDGAEALIQLGVNVEQLDAQALASADLSRYDAIVAGIRAYEVRPDLIAHNQRLLDYARAGGVFVVQYNKYELVDGGFMPYEATMSRPHDRVTDEHADVAVLAPEHPLMSFPNRITAADFEGWVQERGLYHLAAWDPQYTPLLSMADPGEAPQQGALVAARVGRGWYVYSGLALFRQWPEGVPGAYRLLANFVSLGKSSVTM